MKKSLHLFLGIRHLWELIIKFVLEVDIDKYCGQKTSKMTCIMGQREYKEIKRSQ